MRKETTKKRRISKAEKQRQKLIIVGGGAILVLILIIILGVFIFCPYDRVFASRLGSAAGKMILDGEYGFMVGDKNREIVKVPLQDVAGKLKMVSPDASIVQEAKLMGISFGD